MTREQDDFDRLVAALHRDGRDMHVQIAQAADPGLRQSVAWATITWARALEVLRASCRLYLDPAWCRDHGLPPEPADAGTPPPSPVQGHVQAAHLPARAHRVG